MNWPIFILLAGWTISVYQSITCTPPQHFHDAPVNHFHLYLWGYYNDLGSRHQIARDCYETILRTGGAHYTYAGYVRHLLSTQQFQKILSLIPSLDSLFSQQLDIQLIIIKALEAQGKHPQADKRVMALVNQHPDNAELVYYAAAAFVRGNKASDALVVIDRFLHNKPEKLSHFLFHFLKAQIHVQLGEKNQALSCVEKCVDLNPHFEQGWLLSALLHELAGKIDQAIVGYRNFLAIVGHDKMVEQQILNLMIKKEQQKLLPLNDSLFDQALKLYHQRDFIGSLNAINSHLETSVSDLPAQFLKIELLCSLSKASRAVEIIKQWIVKEPESSHWYYLLYLLSLSTTEKKHIDLVLHSLAQRYPTNILPRLYQAQRALNENEYESALAYLDRAEKGAHEPLAIAQIEYQKAVIYFAQGDWLKMHNALQASHQSKKDFAPAHHFYAYYYARHEKDFKKAQHYLDQALALDDSNTSFLHTQARIWYKQKEYHKAPHLVSYQSPHKLPRLKYVDKLQNKYRQHKESIHS